MICPIWRDSQEHGYLCSEVREHCLYWEAYGYETKWANIVTIHCHCTCPREGA
jgi:hypothetical protein